MRDVPARAAASLNFDIEPRLSNLAVARQAVAVHDRDRLGFDQVCALRPSNQGHDDLTDQDSFHDGASVRLTRHLARIDVPRVSMLMALDCHGLRCSS